ncbi:MAG: 6-phosphofructokinase [Phycisphaeraceae bacterium]|nr:6-phosphofructokinase [Phycisphaeraceae bacterium]
MSTGDKLKGNVVVGQSGGPTAVINQSLVGVVEALRDKRGQARILGAHHGVRGVVNEDFIELHEIPQDRLDRVAQTPSSALGSSRDKPDEAYCKKILDVFAKQNVRYFFYIGGNDSSDTCRIVNELAKKAGHELRAFHVPKTIDNDLMHNDHTPGFGSAAKFVAQAFIGDNLDNRALPGIKINVIMGRHAGFLTAASLLARQSETDGPHLIYVPEAIFDVHKFVRDVEDIYKKRGRCLIAVSEGIHDAAGTPIATLLAQQVEKDAHGNVQLSGTGALGDFLSDAIKKHLGAKTRVRADTFGYLQRCFAGCTSTTDADEARMAGRKAAEAALAGHTEGSIAIQRVSSDPYRVDYKLIALSDVAAKTRTLDPKYILDGKDIDESFKAYLQPLVGKLPIVETLRAR